MTAPKPPRLAETLLARLALDNEPLAGDIIEEFRRRTFAALVVAPAHRRARHAGPLRPASSRRAQPDADRSGGRRVDDVEASRPEKKGEPYRERRRRHRRADDGHPGLHDVHGYPCYLVVRRRRDRSRGAAGRVDVEVTEGCVSQHGDTEARRFRASLKALHRARRS